MMIKGHHIKKRYIVGVLAVVFVLVKCTGNDDETGPQQQPITLGPYNQPPAPQAREDGRVYFDQQPAQQMAAAPVQPVIINQQPGNDGFWQGLMVGHLFGGGGSRDVHHYHDSGVSRSNARTSQTTVVNNYHAAPAIHATSVASQPVRYSAPKQNYTSQPKRSWTQANNYSTPKVSYTPRSRSSSWSSRSSGRGRR